jgi:two-component system nitrate/nitrite response regulator NarL
MRDLFICPRNVLRSNWAEACPKAKIHADLESIDFNGKSDAIFWVHSDPATLSWALEVSKRILSQSPDAKIILLSNMPDEAEALLALAQGVVGYCHAYSAPRFLKEVRSVISHGGIWLGAELLHSLMLATKPLVGNSSKAVADNLALLTKREREVALEAAKGLSNKEIARVLNITERTVKAHLSASFERLGLKDRLQLALMLNEKTSGK